MTLSTDYIHFAAGVAAVKILDGLTTYHTAFTSFADLVGNKGTYVPTFEVSHPERKTLADVYDAFQVEVGSDKRTHRYSTPKKRRKPTYQRRVVQVREG